MLEELEEPVREGVDATIFDWAANFFKAAAA